MFARVLLFAQPSRASSCYLLTDNYLWGEASALWPGCLLEVVWLKYTPGELHAIELINGRKLFRYVSCVAPIGDELALEIHGGDASARVMLPRRLVARVGRVRRVFYVRDREALAMPDHRVLKHGGSLTA